MQVVWPSEVYLDSKALWDAGITRGEIAAFLRDYRYRDNIGPYLEADAGLCALYADRGAWARKAILNVANVGYFSIDRLVQQYAGEVWHATPVPRPGA